MRVYHFLTKDNALNNMENEWLKVATINSLNDPFEYYMNMYDSGTLFSEEHVQGIKDRFDKELGYLCFSRSFGNPVQWAHYAANHAGICFEFEIDEKYLHKIDYKPEPIKVDWSEDSGKANFVKATLTKYKHWKYENESRMVIHLKNEDTDDSLVRGEGGYLFQKFTATGTGYPVKVHAGIYCELKPAEIELLSSKGATIHGTKKSRHSYKIEKRQTLYPGA
jgi:hypothetical protein